MNCADFERWLDDALERGRSQHDATAVPHGETVAHMETCASCRQLWTGARLLKDALVACKSRPVQVDLAGRVVAAWLVEQAAAARPAPGARTSGRSTNRSWRAHAALAAAVAAMLLIALRWDAPDRGPQRAVTQARPAEQAVPAPIDRVPAESLDAPVEELVRSAQTAYLALATDAAHTFRDAAQVVVPRDAALPGLDHVASPPGLDNWTPSFTPLQEGFDRALDQWLDRRG